MHESYANGEISNVQMEGRDGYFSERGSAISTILIEESTLTERYQNTVPAAVGKALHQEKGDKVRYTVTNSGEVRLSRVEVEQVDPVVGQFLSFFLASDMQKHPDQ